MANIKNIESAELDRRPIRMEINYDAPHVRIIIETGITVLDQRHKSQEQVSLNGKAAAEFIKMLNIDTLAFDKWLTQDVPLSKNSSIEFSDDYVQLSEKLGKIVEEQNEKLIHGKKK